MSTSPHNLTAAYQACLDEAFRQFQPLIGRWCAGLVDTLYERAMIAADNVEKRQLQDAIAALKKNQSVIEQGFAVELTQAIADDCRAGTGPSPGKSTRSLSSLRFDDLELMGDRQVQETVDSARLLQVVAMACEAGLADLSARLSTAQGFKAVKADKNPLRPEIVSQSLLKLLQELPVDDAARSRWLMHGARLMGGQLQSLYVLLNEQLAAQGIAPAAYGVIATPEARSTGAAGALSTGHWSSLRATDSDRAAFDREPAPALEPAGVDSLLTLGHLHHLLVGDYDDAFQDARGPSGQASEGAQIVPATMDVLAGLKEKGIASVRAEKAQVSLPVPLAQMRAQLRTEGKNLGQLLAVEVVGLMIEQIAQDSRLLLPVRQVIARAEPAFLRLGVTDPHFFSHKDHPARRLLEVVTAKSLAYSSESASGFKDFMQDLQVVAALLTEEHASDARHFATLLQSFEDMQAQRSAGNHASQERAVLALLQAEQRNLLAEKIAAEIRARADFVGGNHSVTAFVIGPWAQVMAKERLLGEHGGLGSQKAVFSLTLGDLLWSLDIAQAARHRKRLVRIIPDMLKSLREGLLSISYPLDQSKNFFDEIMRIHQAALRVEASDPKADNGRALDQAFEAGDAASSTQPWLAPTEAQDSGFMEDWENRNTRPGFETTQPMVREEAPVTAAEAAAATRVALRLGDWVELLSGAEWLRAQLTWVSPYNTLLMFTGEAGRMHSMTARVLQQLLLQGFVKVVSQQGVVDGALDKVARTAMRNSIQENNP